MSDWFEIDRQHIWHPYSAFQSPLPIFPVESAEGVYLHLADGRRLVDGMSSWWCAIHGYNHPQLNQAVQHQLGRMAHVMFGGLTHEPAARLAARLVELTPPGLESVFFTDSGSVAVEVAMKMALQYWIAQGKPERNRFMTVRHGYHGDTFGAMSVCDPDTGMHAIYADNLLMSQHFVDAPENGFDAAPDELQMDKLRQAFDAHAEQTAAFILEPVVQGAGGMRFYSPHYLAQVRRLCDEYDVLLIADEIATGFGRSGRLFACEHADVVPDILCLGKSLTGGYMTLAATLSTQQVAQTISQGEPGVLMHGPTFMANPLACAVANASIDLLLSGDWQSRITAIESWLSEGLEPCRELPQVQDVRVLGAIGVVELHRAVDMQSVQPAFVDAGVWIRPFGRLVYLMPAFIIDRQQTRQLTEAIYEVVSRL